MIHLDLRLFGFYTQLQSVPCGCPTDAQHLKGLGPVLHSSRAVLPRQACGWRWHGCSGPRLTAPDSTCCTRKSRRTGNSRPLGPTLTAVLTSVVTLDKPFHITELACRHPEKEAGLLQERTSNAPCTARLWEICFPCMFVEELVTR